MCKRNWEEKIKPKTYPAAHRRSLNTFIEKKITREEAGGGHCLKLASVVGEISELQSLFLTQQRWQMKPGVKESPQSQGWDNILGILYFGEFLNPPMIKSLSSALSLD